jgi:hypothetical protein
MFHMTKEEYQQLELLLNKLESEIGNKICIIPGYIQDGYYINNYSSKTGLQLRSATGPTIEETVKILKQQSNDLHK